MTLELSKNLEDREKAKFKLNSAREHAVNVLMEPSDSVSVDYFDTKYIRVLQDCYNATFPLVGGVLGSTIYEKIAVNSAVESGGVVTIVLLIYRAGIAINSVEIVYRSIYDFSIEAIGDKILDNDGDPLLDNDGEEIISN